MFIPKNLNAQDLPNNASSFLSQYFPEYNIAKLKFDKKDYEYRVNLNSGHEIKFGANGLWIDIQGDYTPIPKAVIDLLPSGIINYISKNYPRKVIVRIKRKDYGYKIELANSTDLKFTTEGNFISKD